ncbi:MAG: type II toxin-antitoxin system prevent-host-death family antitoxin [Spirochaetes bacterium]|nr:type II toxin-antitoxin system prevent-host-death family antitoxin [Spirochaetota bacterium]
MRFTSVRDLRNRPSSILRDSVKAEEIVLTSNGKPVALVVPVDGDSLEEELRVYRQVRAQVAIERMQKAAKAAGLDSMTLNRIEGIIKDVRRKRARRP